MFGQPRHCCFRCPRLRQHVRVCNLVVVVPCAATCWPNLPRFSVGYPSFGSWSTRHFVGPSRAHVVPPERGATRVPFSDVAAAIPAFQTDVYERNCEASSGMSNVAQVDSVGLPLCNSVCPNTSRVVRPPGTCSAPISPTPSAQRSRFVPLLLRTVAAHRPTVRSCRHVFDRNSVDAFHHQAC